MAKENILDLQHRNPRIASEKAGQDLLQAGANLITIRLSQIHDIRRQGLVSYLIDAARARVEGEAGLGLTSTSPAPLRLAILMLTLRAYERGEVEMAIAPVEAWLAPYRAVRL